MSNSRQLKENLHDNAGDISSSCNWTVIELNKRTVPVLNFVSQKHGYFYTQVEKKVQNRMTYVLQFVIAQMKINLHKIKLRLSNKYTFIRKKKFF